MNYLKMLKNLETSPNSADKTDRNPPDAARENRESLQVGSAKSAKTPPPAHIKRCSACGGTNWGQTGALQGGFERWGCLDCPPAPDSAHSPECPMCGGAYLITDQAGKFCTDCRCRPWEKRESEPVPKPEPLAVRWGSAQGWLRLMNPLTGEVMEIPARGAPKWLFDRLSEQKRSPVRFEKAAQQPMPAVVEKPIVPPTSETEAFWRDDDDIPF